MGTPLKYYLDAQAEDFCRIAELIDAAEEIVICAHTSPDGDALGSELALKLIIEAQWPNKRVLGLLADKAETPRIYRFLPEADQLVCAQDYTGTPDLFISVDLSSAIRLNDARAVMERSRTVAIMDHHPCETPFSEVALIRPEAAAAAVIIAEFALHLGTTITPEMAQCIFCGIMTDTGRFSYQNADAEAFQIASLLMEAGANPSEVSLNVYQSHRLQYLHLKSAVMGRVTTFEKGRIAYSYATSADLERTGASLDECDGLVDEVRSVDGSEIALFIKEIPGGKVRGNLRSKGVHDISVVAQELGGGGHRAASGFTIDGTVDDALCQALPLLKGLLALSDEEHDLL